MAKEFWHIPKRSNLHQAICFIKAIIDRGYDGTTWSQNKQNNLGVNLYRMGATRTGRNISTQAIRTLSALPQYFGFSYVDTAVTPSIIRLTQAGRDLLNYHENELIDIENLTVGNRENQTIKTSQKLLEQFEKLIITNPIITQYCSGILVFPFLFTLRLLLELDYLDKEEVAYFVFKTKDDSEINLKIEEINNFRNLEFDKRKRIIEIYKNTEFGQISLVKAPYANYFFNLLTATGIIDERNIRIPNEGNVDNKSIKSVFIKPDNLHYVKEIVNNKYKYLQTYDFQDDLKLWIDYIGNPSRPYPPRDFQLSINDKYAVLVKVSHNNELIDGNILKQNDPLCFPVFIFENYLITIFDINSGNVIDEINITPTLNNLSLELNNLPNNIQNRMDLDFYLNQIRALSRSNKFHKELDDYLTIVNRIDGVDRQSTSYLRGAYYEYYFFQLLNYLSENEIIDDVHWYGSTGRFDIPTAAPGGEPDIIVKINDIFYLMEFTTIKTAAMQFSAEAASVPSHMRSYSYKHPNDEIIGIFCAPKIHDRTRHSMIANLNAGNHSILCIEEDELLTILSSNTKEELIRNLTNFQN